MGYHGILWEIFDAVQTCIDVGKVLEVVTTTRSELLDTLVGDSWWDCSLDCNHSCLPSRKFEEELRVKVLPLP